MIFYTNNAFPLKTSGGSFGGGWDFSNNAFNLHKITKIRVKSQKYGRNTGDFAKMPVYTGMPV